MLKKILVSSCMFLFSCFCYAEFIENSDITTYLNQQLKLKSEVRIPAGSYKIDAGKSIVLPSNSSLILSPNTNLNVIPNKLGSYRVFKIKNVKNVKISGGKVIGDKYTHLGKTGEWGMGVEIRDSQNISISDMSIDKMWGDAIYVGTDGKNSTYNIKLNNIVMNDNRRQGLTIISVDTLNVRNLKATNTSGAKPSGGIDIEPNNGTGVIRNISLENIVTSNNAGPGIQIGLSRYDNTKKPVSIKINNHTDIGSQYGLLLGAISAVPSGKIEMKSINYSKSKNASCFNSWTNKKFNIDILGDIGLVKTRYCMAYLKHPNINIKSFN
ncbi:right-handed parallel beta-helix repeat-containing protein [Acinetobacter sp. UBA2581]|uniref:right-handed parallel beta-helix repeat-containing protein n=1 Tax=Acinetobacter sp. UBA2581 TaxID=1945932 RepID=UPI00257DC065|nr:right-handed parallel beta-helix repeat-containing protein [Acinetobacter sp. UBA2581]